jgi:molybdate transport system substrate-binding protein
VRFRAPLTAVLVLVLAACAGGNASPVPSISCCDPTVPAVELTIYAAASLKGALDAAKTGYEAADESITLVISTDSSAALETKIEQGAPADVFLSADTTNPQKLIDGGFASGAAVTFAGNKLTVIVPTDNPAGIATPADLAKAGLKIIGAGDEVPITKYAKRLVANLARESGYPAGFEAAYTANVASKEENVKAVVAKIELGEGDAGIVYVTDAKASTKVKAIDVPATANVPATYAGVVVKTSPNQAAASAFLAWFAGPDGQAILGQFGFLQPS